MPINQENVLSLPDTRRAESPEALLSIFLDCRREACAKHYRLKLVSCAKLLGLTLHRFIEQIVDTPDDLILPLRRAMMDAGLAVSTRAKLFTVLQTFCRQMLFAGYMRRIPAIPIEKIPKKWVDGFEILTHEDIAVLEQWISQLPKQECMLSKAFLGLLYFRGLRESEALSIRLSDIDFKNKTIAVLSKGGEERSVIPVEDCVLEYIRPLYREIKNLTGDQVEQSLFVAPTEMLPVTHEGTMPGMTVTWVEMWAKKKVSGILNKKVTTHTFRRSAITALVDMDTPVMAAAAFARHTTTYMLERYYQRKEASALRCQSRLAELHHGTDEEDAVNE